MTGGTRAGSLRVTPSTSRSISTATRTTANGSTEETQRLSIGKYLGGSTSVSTSGASSAAAANAQEITELKQNINELHQANSVIENDITDLENTKQDKLTAGNYVVIQNDEVSIDLTSLEEYLTENLELPNKVKIQYDSANNKLQWSENGGTSWQDLMDMAALTGDYVSIDDLEDKIDTLAKYATKAELATLESKVDTKANTSDVNTALATKANASDVYDKTAIDEKLATVASGAAMTEALAGKQPISTSDNALGTAAGGWSPLTSEQMAAINSGVTSGTVTAVATNAQNITTLNDTKASKAELSSLSDRVTTNEGAIAQNASNIATKANADDVYTKTETYSKTEVDTKVANIVSGDVANALSTKADSSTVTALSERVDTNTQNIATNATAIEQNATNIATKADQTAVDSALALKANAADVYTAAQTDVLLNAKANASDIPAAQVQSDWSQANSESVDFIKNKPTKLSEFANDTNYATTTQLSEGLAEKQPTLTATQLAAVNSGVTGTTVAQVAAHSETLELLDGAVRGKQDSLDDTQMAAVNSGITADKVSAYDAYATTIATKADTATVNAALETKANADDVYPKSETYTRDEVAAAISNAAFDPASLVFDTALDANSTNAVQNKVVTSSVNSKIDKGNIPSLGEYVLGYVDGVQAYIPVVDADGNAKGPTIAAATGDEL